MDPNAMRILGNARYQSIVRDADAARLMQLSGRKRRHGSSCERGARRTGAADTVNHALSAMLRCHWRQAEQEVARLANHGAAQLERLAVSAVLARLIGTHREADDLLTSLRVALPDSGGDPHIWAATMVAIALQSWADGDDNRPVGGAPSVSSASIALIRDLCARALKMGGEARDLLCLSLALQARTAGAQVVGSFLLGHLTENSSPAGRAARGLSFVTLGEMETGRRILLGVIDATDSLRMPLVEGLVDAEMARLDHEAGDDSGARGWMERTDRFTQRYGCPLPAEVGRAAS